LIDGSQKASEPSNPDPFGENEQDHDMGDDKRVNDIFDVNDPNIEMDAFDDLDIGLDADASIHPLTLKGGEDAMYADGFDDGFKENKIDQIIKS